MFIYIHIILATTNPEYGLSYYLVCNKTIYIYIKENMKA